jgi:hypothetical protein
MHQSKLSFKKKIILQECSIKNFFKLNFEGFFIKLALICILFCSNVEASIIQPQEIPPKDIKSIERFFKYIIFQTTAPFTLFGDKPITLINFNTEVKPLYFIEASYSAVIIKDFKIWKSYESKCSKNFAFKEEVEKDSYSIILINKKNCLATIESNLELFHEILDTKLTAEEILDRICNSRVFSQDVLQSHQGLLGILLGYGKNNSMAFHDIYTEQRLFYKPLQFFNNEPHDPLLLFSMPDFVAIENDLETQTLKESYIKTRKQITALYRKGELLEAALKKIVD